jgi:hypothetical protein
MRRAARLEEGVCVEAAVTRREVEASRQAVIAATNNRSPLGTLNDFSFMLKWQFREGPAADLVPAALDLSGTPIQPLGPGFPDRVTRELLAGSQTG